MPILDSNVLIRLEQGEPAALAAFDRLREGGEPLVVPAQAAVEYLAGTVDKVAELAILQASFEVVHTGDAQVLEAASLVERALEAGFKPRWADAAIAAVAVLEGTFVVTTNKRHFTQLGVAAWNYETERNPPSSD